MRHYRKSRVTKAHPNYENLLQEPLKPEVCGKIWTCRPHWIVTTLLPAVSFHEKGGALEGFGICSIFPSGAYGSSLKTRDRTTWPLFKTTATRGFVEHLLGLSHMDSRNAPVGGADRNIAVPNGNIPDASGRCLSAILQVSKRAITHF